MGHAIAFFAVGILAGSFGSILGLGGGIIVVPALNLFLDIPIHNAIATSLLAVIATSTGASIQFLRRNLTDLRLGITLEVATTLGAFAGGVSSGVLGTGTLRLLFGAFLLYIVGAMSGRPERVQGSLAMVGEAAGSTRSPAGRRVTHLPLGLGASFFAGVLSGLLGVGGGTIKIPVMYLGMNVPLKIATATSAYMIGFTALASSVIYEFQGKILPVVSAEVVLGVFIGSILGGQLSGRLSSRTIRWVFIAVILIMSVQMIVRGAMEWL